MNITTIVVESTENKKLQKLKRKNNTTKVNEMKKSVSARTKDEEENIRTQIVK